MYQAYQPLSKKPDATAFVPPELHEAQKQGISSIEKNTLKNWDDIVAKDLGFSKEELWSYFSSEQIDSIGLALWNFKKNKAFIIGDETGIGKGRILSGICRWAFLQGKKVMFFTEREHLFSDFWRDLTDTKTLSLLNNPIVFHGTAKIYNPQGEMVLKGSPKQVKTIEEEGFSPDTNFVLSNYSQISLKQHKKNKKNILEDFCHDNLIILDESHNATGDSNTKKFLLELLDKTPYVLYSSATFIKDESQLELYQKTINFDANTLELFKKLLKNDKDLVLRKIFTYELTRRLQFWRREHEPLSVGWQTLICPKTIVQEQSIDIYSNIINELFQLTNQMSKMPEFESLNLTSNWFSFGSTINRLSRNLLLLLKVPTLVEGIEKILAEDKKAVIVLDSTFSSLINKIISHQDVDDEDDVHDLKDGTYELNFFKVLHYVIDEIVGNFIKEKNVDGEILQQYEALLQKAQYFKSLFVSPIDYIIDKLKEKNIRCNEISGRSFKVIDNSKIEKIKKQPKSLLVKQFNDGEVNVIVLTRAGASGISLHASAAFKDKRIRVLFELEITNRPNYRLQFIGRVHRKNQVQEPEFYSVITELPFEQRILNVEKQKIEKMQSHISGDDDKHDQENIHNFYTEYCDLSAKIFLNNHKHLAFQMGINIQGQKEDFYYIDNILKRCIVLSYEQQNKLYDYLIYASQCERKLGLRKNKGLKSEMVKITNFWHQLDEIQKEQFKQIYGKLPQNSINQFNFAWVGLMELKTTYESQSVYIHALQNELKNNLSHNAQIKKYFQQVLTQIHYKQEYGFQFINEQIKPLLNHVQIGTCLGIKNIEGTIFGYIHDVKIPPVSKPHEYSDLCIIEIKTVSPHLHPSIKYCHENYYLTLRELIEAGNITIYNQEIDWKKFNRPQKQYERSQLTWVGHPIYMEFLKQAYNIGETKYVDSFGKKNMYVFLPDNLSENNLKNLKKPIYSANKIMEGLISKNIRSLTTSWQHESEVKPSMKLLPITGGYNLYIANEIFKNSSLIDFPLRKKLKNKRGQNNGFETFFLPYKEVRSILFTLELRDVIWFINND